MAANRAAYRTAPTAGGWVGSLSGRVFACLVIVGQAIGDLDIF
jgi:hypothetical protein